MRMQTVVVRDTVSTHMDPFPTWVLRGKRARKGCQYGQPSRPLGNSVANLRPLTARKPLKGDCHFGTEKSSELDPHGPCFCLVRLSICWIAYLLHMRLSIEVQLLYSRNRKTWKAKDDDGVEVVRPPSTPAFLKLSNPLISIKKNKFGEGVRECVCVTPAWQSASSPFGILPSFDGGLWILKEDSWVELAWPSLTYTDEQTTEGSKMVDEKLNRMFTSSCNTLSSQN